MFSSSPINHKEKHSSHWHAVATVCIGAFMAALDASINVALFGRRWLYTFGFIIFSLSSLFCGLAP